MGYRGSKGRIKSGIYLILILCLGACVEVPQKQTNVLFILVDDLGWTDLGCYGSTFHETPHIDKLAAEGIKFTQAYASSPVCSPTRAAIMTGKNPASIGITDWIPGLDPQDRKLLGPSDKHELPLEEYTLGEAFKEHGYQTFFAGKWHLGDQGYFPEDQGFDFNKGGHHRGSPPGGYYTPYKNPKLSDGPAGEYLTDRLTEESLQFMEQHRDEPFFLFLSYYTVHTPIQPNTQYLNAYKEKLSQMSDSLPRKEAEHEGMTVQNQANAEYASMVHALDVNIGRLTQKLKDLGIEDNTLIVFTSDNGGLSTLYPNRTAPTSVKPLRGGKGWCYEGGIRVPLIFHMPSRIQPRVSEAQVISHDFYPTLLLWTGISPAPKKTELGFIPTPLLNKSNGKSLVPVLEGKADSIQRKALFWHFPHYHGSAWKPGAAIRKGPWKLIEFYEEEKTELYNLDNDLSESLDLSQQFPEKLKELKQELKFMQGVNHAKFPSPNPSFTPNE